MLKTRFTELLGCDVPISQAPIGDLATPDLAAAVADAGGLGMVCVYDYPPEVIEKELGELRKRTSGVFGANFIMRIADPGLARDMVAAAAAHADVVDFFYSDPDSELVQIVHDAGALACWQVGSKSEALAAVESGCDFIIAQGIEAGGHVRGTVGLTALLNQVLDAVDVPVLGSGGIGNGRAMAAVLAAGADGVRLGTRFIGAVEADAHPDYLKALFAAKADDTIYTDAFSNGWPGAPHRLLKDSLDAAEAFEGEIVGEIVPLFGDRPHPLRRFQPHTLTRRVSGRIEAMPHWAGESVDGLNALQPAAEIVRELVADCEKYLHRWC